MGPRANPIRDGATADRMRAAALADPGAFHGEIARREIHWYVADRDAWLTLDGAVDGDGGGDDGDAPTWHGFDATTGEPVVADDLDADFEPWARAFDDDDAPFYHWFVGGVTNAAFNEVDRHVLAGHGDEVAYIVESDGWDDEQEAPVARHELTRAALLRETTLAALALRDLGLAAGDRIALNLPNLVEQIVWSEAAKRLGIVYVPTFGGFSARTLADRIADAGARVLITADGGHRNGAVVTYKGAYADPALEELGADSPVEAVVVVRHTGEPTDWTDGRDRWAHELLEQARAQLPPDFEDLEGAALWRACEQACPVARVGAEWPLFVIYTSGSTGKPKGVVHVHGGYVAGVAHTMKVAFDAVPGEDTIFVVADPGWITGQSYLICAALTTRTTSVLIEGTPLWPTAGRFASVIERNGVTIFKAGVTFLRSVMADSANQAAVQAHDTSTLRVATFCAEPVSPVVQQYGMEVLCRHYVNSYWATEHGGIVWTTPYANPDLPLHADATAYPLPWVAGDVWLDDGAGEQELTVAGSSSAEPQNSRLQQSWRRAEDGERGELVITAPYPYLARTVFGDAARIGEPGWTGDRERWVDTYWSRFPGSLVYAQGDFARRLENGAFTFHGRSDDVINVSGHRIGTEEIEGALLRDKALQDDSPVGNVVVVGAPHAQKGLTPLAFVQATRELTDADRQRLRDLVRTEKGAVAVPQAADFITVPELPETRSGKYVRRLLSALVEGADPGDLSSLRNPHVIEELEPRIAAWRDRAR